ncbi:MAG: two-component regulator propeller domain-containing protein, partial [Ferruginibacter sp.]
MRFLIWVVLLLQVLSAFAQSEHYNFSKLDTYTGLSNNQVNAILKDQDGFLWFGTMSGLDRYDGYSYRVFRKNYNDSSSLPDNSIQSLYELPGGKMWVSTMGGGCIYNSATEKFDADINGYLQSLGLPSGTVVNIVKGNNGRYWFLYDNLELHSYSGTDKKSRSLRLNLGVNSLDRISSIKETKDGKLWLVSQNGFLQEYDMNSNKIIFSSTVIQNLNKEDNPFYLNIDTDGDIWLWALNSGVFLFHPEDYSIRQFNENSFPSRLNSNLVSQVVQDNKGLIWVATDHGGVNLIDKKNNFSISYLLNDPKNPRSLGQNSIKTMYKDNDGIIWLGSAKQGISYLNSNIVFFPLYRHMESNIKSLPYDDVNRFVEDKSGNLWIGTNGGGLIFFDRKQNTFKQYLHDPNNKNSLSNNIIVSMCLDHDNVLWIGTYFGGLNSFDGQQFKHYRHSDNDASSLANNNVWEIFEDREQNLYIGTLGGGLDIFDRKTNRFKHIQYRGALPNSLSFNYITSILQDKKGNLWIGTSGGIAIIEKNKATPVFYQKSNDKNSLSDNNVICISEDSKGRIWVGTREGLNLFNEQTKRFQTFTTLDGLPDNTIRNILEDSHQSLWI